MGEQRKKSSRIRIDIRAKGVIRHDSSFFQYSATAINFSDTQVFLKFTEDATRRANEAMEEGFDFQSAEVLIQFVSYVEENIPATGVVAKVSQLESAVLLEVDLNQLDDRSMARLDKILEISPNLRESAPKGTAEIKFRSFNEFLDELTQLTILTQKQSSFFIGKEEFAFTGTHTDDNGDIHCDCIESISRPGVIFCPDCRAKIPPEQLT